MQKLLQSPYENVPQLAKQPAVALQERLPSFRDGFSDWAPDANHMRPMESEIVLDRASNWQGDAGSQLPGIPKLLQGEWECEREGMNRQIGPP